LTRIIVGLVLASVAWILGFAFMIRMWVHQGYHTKFALEFIGFNDPGFTETFPQITFCPGYHNVSGTLTQGVIDSVVCTFHDVQPGATPEEKKEHREDVSRRGPVTHVIDFRKYDNCYDVNIDANKAPKIQWQDSHSYIACRVGTNTYVHTQVYNIGTNPSHVLSRYNNIKNGEATSLSIRAEEMRTADWSFQFYEIEKEDEEFRFSGHHDHLWATFSFSHFSKKRYQGFSGPHQQADVTIGMIGGFAFLFFMLYQLIAWVTRLFSPAVGFGEAETLVK
jgi:hypothetical protein